MSNILLEHCKGHYYREFAFKTLKGIDIPNGDGVLPDLRRLVRKPVRDNEMLVRVLKRYDNRPGKYISVYSYERLDQKGHIDYTSAKIDRVYLDFDHDSNPQYAIFDALLLIRSLVRRGIFCHCYFSGNRGIALYVEFITVDIKPENKKTVVGMFFDMLVEAVKDDYENFFGLIIPTINKGFGYNLETIDYQIRGDIARVSRLPNSKHKSGLYCVPLSFGDMYKGIDHIRRVAKERLKKNMDDTISYVMMRNNPTMQTIITNIEKQVEINRIFEARKKEIEQRKRDYYRLMHPDNKRPVSDKEIELAKQTPLSNVISNETRTKCPIHGGDNPTSFYIDHHKNYWYCHSCGKGGDAITYLMEKNGIDFVTAVKQLVGGSE